MRTVNDHRVGALPVFATRYAPSASCDLPSLRERSARRTDDLAHPVASELGKLFGQPLKVVNELRTAD
jgi:hypothetical protein